MAHLFSLEGSQAIEEIAARSPLLALDFDGTLAPIVALPELARAPAAVSRVLTLIAEILPIAIVTGRAVSDVSDRLGFVPRYIVGNHGAEGLPGRESVPIAQTVNIWREEIARRFDQELASVGVTVEYKGHSVSFHYRTARDRVQAQQVIEATIALLVPIPRVIGGKCVINLLPQEAPDKYQAVVSLVKLAHCETVIFIGDDITDDVVFENARPDWLTIRIEAQDHHRARFHLNHQSEVAIFLQRLLSSLERHAQRQALNQNQFKRAQE